MNRSAQRTWIVALAAVALPVALHAQEPKDDKWTKDATKSLTMAQLQQKPELYQEALATLREGMQQDPGNAKVWMLAGQAEVGLDMYAAADSAFDKAAQLHPDYKEDIRAYREQAWLKAFQAGTSAMDRNQADSAVAMLQKAESIYDERPEGVLNLGMLYANTGKNDQAVAAFQAAKERLHGPLLAQLKPEDQAQWKQYEAAADMTLSQIYGNEGITAFNAGKYDDAATAFKKAMDINTNSRDYIYNYVQSLYAKIGELEKQQKADSAQAKALAPQLAPLYQQIVPAAQKALSFDPAALDLYVIINRAYRGQAALAATPAEKADFQKKAEAIITEASKLPFEVSDVAVSFADSSATLKGNVKTRTAKPGDALKMKVSFLAPDGSVLGTGDVNVTAGAPDKPVPFQVSAPVKGQVAGWKYEVVQ